MTPTNEEVRRQFEAWAKDERGYSDGEIAKLRAGSGYHMMADLHLPWAAYQAALSSPAVVALVEAAKACRETELGDMACVGSMAPCEDALGRLFAALAPFTTGA